ncbi:MAG: hypothetical protein ABMA13_12350 [Chthoniobacteraceae bacterium]
MADNQIDIGIRTTADTSGAEKAKAAIRDIREEAEKPAAAGGDLFKAPEVGGAAEMAGVEAQIALGGALAAGKALQGSLFEYADNLTGLLDQVNEISNAIGRQAQEWQRTALAATSGADVAEISVKSQQQLDALTEKLRKTSGEAKGALDWTLTLLRDHGAAMSLVTLGITDTVRGRLDGLKNLGEQEQEQLRSVFDATEKQRIKILEAAESSERWLAGIKTGTPVAQLDALRAKIAELEAQQGALNKKTDGQKWEELAARI